ncbi:MAG: putative ABC transporter permease [Clostridia bacterium]|nr:putative ABC transporter permease [Clostridia bacterium]
MEQTIEKENVVENTERIVEKKEKKKFTIAGISIWRLLAYFIIYSVVGFIIETLFGFVTKGVIESRKSFLYGPFCAIYGVGAVIMIPLLQRFKKNNYTLFFGGFVIGSIVEYVISLIGEMIFHIKWWDYSEMAFNIQGRICIAFSFFWGILAIYLMSHFNPKIDKLIDKIKEKISPKVLKTVCIILILFMFIDFLITSFALKMFFTRIVAKNNLKLATYDEYIFECAELYKNEDIKEFTLKYFSDEKMMKTFPNIKLTGEDGNVIWICDVLKDIQPYYVRVFTPSYSK